MNLRFHRITNKIMLGWNAKGFAWGAERVRFILLCTIYVSSIFGSEAFARTPVDTIRAVLSSPVERLNFERAKVEFDRIVEQGQKSSTEDVDRIAASALAIDPSGNDIARLQAVRHVIYDSGAWNDNRPFTYDQADPYGANLHNKLLATYLDTRRGNCVSMPILHLIVAERLGLNVSLSTAPLHVFVRYTNPANGRSLAIEATSGGYPAREVWYHEKMGVTDAQVQSGIYLGVLTKRESIAVMASTVTEWLMSQRRYAEAINVADVLLEYYPKDIHALLSRGTAYGALLQREFTDRYPTPAAIPPNLRPRYRMLAEQNAAAFRQAESWGWTPPPSN